jgi:hypothetical protein
MKNKHISVGLSRLTQETNMLFTLAYGTVFVNIVSWDGQYLY